MKYFLNLILMLIAFDVNAESKCNLKKDNLILKSYEIGIKQLYTLNGNGELDIKKIKYNGEFEGKVLKNVFQNNKQYCSFDYSSYSVDNKVFGLIVFGYNDLNKLDNDFKEIVKKKGFSDKKVITTFRVNKDNENIYLFYGNYMYLNEFNKTINAIY